MKKITPDSFDLLPEHPKPPDAKVEKATADSQVIYEREFEKHGFLLRSEWIELIHAAGHTKAAAEWSVWEQLDLKEKS